MPTVYIGRFEQKLAGLTRKDVAPRETSSRTLEQMDNDEEKRRELAILKCKSMRGVARANAIVEERRRAEEYSKQRQCLFPQTRVLRSTADVKGKQRAIPVGLQPEISPDSTTRPSDTSGHRSPPSSTSTPPPDIARAPPRKTRTVKLKTKPDYICMSSERYRLYSIPPWFFADQACTAYATPAPDLKHVMELGVLHTTSVMS